MTVYEVIGIIGLVLAVVVFIATVFGFIDWRS
jgi:preprotein translocase subunit SecE